MALGIQWLYPTTSVLKFCDNKNRWLIVAGGRAGGIRTPMNPITVLRIRRPSRYCPNQHHIHKM